MHRWMVSVFRSTCFDSSYCSTVARGTGGANNINDSFKCLSVNSRLVSNTQLWMGEELSGMQPLLISVINYTCAFPAMTSQNVRYGKINK